MADDLQAGLVLEPDAMVPLRPELAAEEEPASWKEGLFQDTDPCSDCGYHANPGTTVKTLMPEGKNLFPQIIQTNELLFYERFRAYQDYILADCKASQSTSWKRSLNHLDGGQSGTLMCLRCWLRLQMWTLQH